MTKDEKIEWAIKVNVTALSRVDLIDAVLTLREAIESGACLPASLQEALNSGDGTYRP